jgi:hypothetical protein
MVPSGSGTGTYQVTGFLSDYRTSDTATSLSTSSDVSMTVGAGVKNGNDCSGMAASGRGWNLLRRGDLCGAGRVDRSSTTPKAAPTQIPSRRTS